MIETALIGAAAGVVAGMFGVGGGILFVPALVFVAGLSQVDAEATSLLAMIPVAILGAYRQHRYGNLRPRDGALLGVLGVFGTVGGIALANALPERALEVVFACLLLLIAAQMGRRGARGLRQERRERG
jgi:uncharacterized membrane protein YfcA